MGVGGTPRLGRLLRSYPPDKRRVLVAAFLAVRAEEITDAIVQMFDVLVARLFYATGGMAALADRSSKHRQRSTCR